MKTPDRDKERSERKLTVHDFLKEYNTNLPEQFPLASLPLLKKFQKDNPVSFTEAGVWTLDKHRKQFMDWLRQHLRLLQLQK